MTSEYEKHVERRARARAARAKELIEADGVKLPAWDDMAQEDRDRLLILEHATMEADREAGLALVPAEATWEAVQVARGVFIVSTGVKAPSHQFVERVVNAAIREGNVLEKNDG